MWCVERVLYGDGSADNNGVTLKEKPFYGCASTDGGHESFQRIDIRSLKLFESIIYLPFALDGEKKYLYPKANNLISFF